jgi:hypothetical protein
MTRRRTVWRRKQGTAPLQLAEHPAHLASIDKTRRQRLYAWRYQQMPPLASQTPAKISRLRQSCPSLQSQRASLRRQRRHARTLSGQLSEHRSMALLHSSENHRRLCNLCGRDTTQYQHKSRTEGVRSRWNLGDAAATEPELFVWKSRPERHQKRQLVDSHGTPKASGPKGLSCSPAVMTILAAASPWAISGPKSE